jgi:hypothetical protein
MSRRKAYFACACFILLTLMGLVIWKGTRLTKQADEPPLASSESENDFLDAAPSVTDLEKLLQEARYESDRTVEYKKGSALYYVSILRGCEPKIPGRDTQWFVLRDRERKLLDVVSCSINNRLTNMSFGDFITEVLDPPGEDGAGFVLRLLIENDRDFGGHFSHTVISQGTVYIFHWHPDSQRAVPAADLKSKGLCRLAIKDEKFAVLFPSLKEAAWVSRIDE